MHGKENPELPGPRDPAAPQTKLTVGELGAPRGQRPRTTRDKGSVAKNRRGRLRVPHWTAFPRKLHAPLGAAKDFG